MRNIKLTETEWKYICDALGYGSTDLADSWEDEGIKYGTKEWDRKNELLKKAERQIFWALREVS